MQGGVEECGVDVEGPGLGVGREGVRLGEGDVGVGVVVVVPCGGEALEGGAVGVAVFGESRR